MNPEMGVMGGRVIYSYGFHSLVSFLLLAIVLAILLRLRGQNMGPAIDLTILMILGYAILARAFHAVLAKDWAFFSDFGLHRFGAGFWGGQLGFALPAGLYLLWTRAPFRPLADALAVAWAFASVPQKIGCFLAGCCYGSETSLAWAVVFPSNSQCRLPGVPLHPSQLYDAALTLLVACSLLWTFLQRKSEGRLLLWWGLLYAILKYTTEWTRGDRMFVVAGPMTAGMVVEVVTAAFCALHLSRPAAWNFLLSLRDLRTAAGREPEGGVKRSVAFALTLGNGILSLILAGAVANAGSPALPLLVFFAVHVLGSLLSGVNPMLRFLSLRLVNQSGEPASLVRLFLRGFMGPFAIWSFFGLFRPLLDRSSRSLGDAVAGTWLVRPPPD